MGERADWGNSEELLARVVDALDYLARLIHQAKFKPPHPKPVRVPRPGEAEPPPPFDGDALADLKAELEAQTLGEHQAGA